MNTSKVKNSTGGRSSQHSKMPSNVGPNLPTSGGHSRGRSLNQTGPISATNAARQKQIAQHQVGPQTTKASQSHNTTANNQQQQNSRTNQKAQFGTQQPTHTRANHSLGYRQGHTGRNVQHMVLTTNNAGKVIANGNGSGAPTASQKGMKNLVSSSSGLANGNTASGKNMRSMSLSKRLAIACGVPPQNGIGNQTIDLSQMHAANNFQTLEQPDSHQLNNNAILAQQFNTLMTQNELAAAQASQAGQQNKRDRKGAQSMPKTTTNKRSKHAKAFSMVQNSYRGNQMLQQAYQNQMPFSGRAPPATEQFLNQPLQQMNSKLINQQIQQMQQMQLQSVGMPMGVMSQDVQTPLDYQKMYGVDALGQGGSAFNFAQIMSPKDPQQLMPANAQQQQIFWQQQQDGQQTIPVCDQNYSFLLQQQNNHHQLPFTGGSGSITQLGSNASGLQQQTGRSISHCSGRNFQKMSSGNVNKQTQGKAAGAPNIPEGQLLESEENFESGKVFLAEQKYSEAIKMFTKSLNMNKQNFDALFYRAVSNLDSGQPAKAITDLSDLVDKCPDYRKTMFIVLSIAYRRINDYQGALRTLSKALLRYPRYIEAYIARGQIYIFQKKWEKALSDFRSVIQLQQHNGLGYLGQGDSLKGIGNYNEALVSFSKAIEVDTKTVSQGLMKRGLLFLQMKMSEQALQDFDKLTEIAEGTEQPPTALSKAYFYKAKALKKLNNLSDAILYFEQVIRANDDNHLASSALYEIAKIKIQQKDFYEAYYNLKRANHFKLRQKKLVTYKMFTEGVIFLMKRKTKTALKLICQVADRLKPSDAGKDAPPASPDYIYNLVFLYRAYGYFVCEDYESSLKDYIKANQVKKLNHSSLYNMVLCQGLKCLSNTEYENAISFFTKCSQKLPNNRDPYLLRAIAIVRYAMHKPIKPKTKTKMLKDAKRDLNKAMQNSVKDYNVLYLRGLINFALHFFYDAISDLETVIEKSEEASAKHYLARGRCYACLSMFKEAITDLSIAINLNKDLLDAYLNRGKCAYLIGDTGLAFMDFQKLIVIEPKNPMVHIYAGNLLMTTGSYEDATKAFTNADNIHKSSLALYQRGRCNVALNQMTEALKDLNKVLETAQNDKVAIADRECLNALKSASGGGSQRAVPAGAAEQSSVTGPIQPHEKNLYGKAVVSLTKLIGQENNEHLSKIMHDSSIQHQHSQMIPSAQRTKVDKIRAIRRRKEQDRAYKEGKSKRNDLRFRVQQPPDQEEQDEFEDISDLDPDEIIKLNRQLEAGSNASQGADKSDDEADAKEAEEANYYKENIFNKEDYYLYRGVMQIYAGEYEKAIGDFDQSSQIMHANKVLYPRNQFPDDEDLQSPNDNASNASSQTDLSDVGLCSLNIHEYSYNSVICRLCQRNYKKALETLNYMLETIPKKYANQLWLIRSQVHQLTGNHSQAKKDLKRAEKYDSETFVRFLQQKESVYLTVFPTQSRLCNQFAFVKTPLVNGAAAVHLRPSFSFPFIKPPNMIPCVDNNVLDSLTPSSVPLKPEAPWIKRCSFGIKFTDEIYMTDDDRENTPDEEKEYKKRKARQQERDINGGEYIPRSLSEKVYVRNNIFTAGAGNSANNAPSPQKGAPPAAAKETTVQQQAPNVRRVQKVDEAAAAAEIGTVRKGGDAQAAAAAAAQQRKQNQQVAEEESAGEGQYSDVEGMSQEDDFEEDEFEQEYRERRKAYDKLEDIKQLKESIRRVTTNGQAKNIAKGQDAARDHVQDQKQAQRHQDDRGAHRGVAPPNARFAVGAEEDEHDEEDAMDEGDEGMIEESFSVGGSEIYDQEVAESQQKHHHKRQQRQRGHKDDQYVDEYEDDEEEAIDSSGKQNLADIKKSLRQR